MISLGKFNKFNKFNNHRSLFARALDWLISGKSSPAMAELFRLVTYDDLPRLIWDITEILL